MGTSNLGHRVSFLFAVVDLAKVARGQRLAQLLLDFGRETQLNGSIPDAMWILPALKHLSIRGHEVQGRGRRV